MWCMPGCVCEVSEGSRSNHPMVQGGTASSRHLQPQSPMYACPVRTHGYVCGAITCGLRRGGCVMKEAPPCVCAFWGVYVR
jgi:hypothetical protein